MTKLLATAAILTFSAGAALACPMSKSASADRMTVASVDSGVATSKVDRMTIAATTPVVTQETVKED